MVLPCKLFVKDMNSMGGSPLHQDVSASKTFLPIFWLMFQNSRKTHDQQKNKPLAAWQAPHAAKL